MPTNLPSGAAQERTSTGLDDASGVDDVLIEDVSIDGMCGVY